MEPKQHLNLIKTVFRAVLVLSFLFTFNTGQNIFTAHAAGTIRYAVPGGVTSGACNSWGNACELRYVLSSVAVAGDQIWVKAGTYKPTAATDRSISFVLTNGVALYGGFNGTETQSSQRVPASNITILSGEIGAAGTSDNSYHVVIGSGTNNTAVLDGFTITAGNATNDKGGGMWNYGGSPTLTNLIFNANSALYGGGLCNENNSNPVLTTVTFNNNQISHSGYGGGMYNKNSSPILTNVIFSNNQTAGSYGYGAGLYNDNSNPTLKDVTFSGNTSNYEGGGMENYYSSPTLTNVTFNGNSATYGGGMVNGRNSNGKLINVTFNGNTASLDGGGLSNGGWDTNLTLTDVIFINNKAGNNGVASSGGGMINGANAKATLTNVAFNGNVGTSSGGAIDNGGELVLTNVTFLNNVAGEGGAVDNHGNLLSFQKIMFQS